MQAAVGAAGVPVARAGPLRARRRLPRRAVRRHAVRRRADPDGVHRRRSVAHRPARRRARRGACGSRSSTRSARSTRVDADGLGLRAGLTGELEWWERYVGWATDGSPPPALAEALAWCRAQPARRRAAVVAAVGRCAARQRRVRPRPARAAGGPRLGHGQRRPGRDGPRVVPRPRAAPADLTGMTVPASATVTSHRRDEATSAAAADLDWYEVFASSRQRGVDPDRILFERAGQRHVQGRRGPDAAAALARISAEPESGRAQLARSAVSSTGEGRSALSQLRSRGAAPPDSASTRPARSTSGRRRASRATLRSATVTDDRCRRQCARSVEVATQSGITCLTAGPPPTIEAGPVGLQWSARASSRRVRRLRRSIVPDRPVSAAPQRRLRPKRPTSEASMVQSLARRRSVDAVVAPSRRRSSPASRRRRSPRRSPPASMVVESMTWRS